jgi:hypothetical protein
MTGHAVEVRGKMVICALVRRHWKLVRDAPIIEVRGRGEKCSELREMLCDIQNTIHDDDEGVGLNSISHQLWDCLDIFARHIQFDARLLTRWSSCHPLCAVCVNRLHSETATHGFDLLSSHHTSGSTTGIVS